MNGTRIAILQNITADVHKCIWKKHCEHLDSREAIFGEVESTFASVFAAIFAVFGIGYAF